MGKKKKVKKNKEVKKRIKKLVKIIMEIMIIMIIIRPMETESNSKSRQYIKKTQKTVVTLGLQ